MIDPNPTARRVGLVVPTAGRWDWLEELFDSLKSSSVPLDGAVIANQSGDQAPTNVTQIAGVEIVTSAGGASRGRNDGLRALGNACDIIALPNDHSRFRPDTLSRVVGAFDGTPTAGALAGTLVEPGGARFQLPPAGTPLTRWSVWRAIEPAMFITPEVGRLGFNPNLGTGNKGPWQAGEGTDLLLRAMANGHSVISAPEVEVLGRGEHRGLTEAERAVKLRSYARGTGFVMRLQHAGPLESAVHVLSPFYRLLLPAPDAQRPTLSVTAASVLGRLEGRLGRCLPGVPEQLDAPSLRK